MVERTVVGMLHLFDTSSGALVPFEPKDEGKVSMYVCGPTVYGPPHLGHGRFSLVFDILRRYLEWSGYEVTYVSNITDIDDNIINKAAEDGIDPADLAISCEKLWYEAMDAIGVKRPTQDPHATAFVERMVAFIEGLIANGSAYETADGVYFSVEDVDDYGLLARQSLDSLRSGARVDVGEDKQSPLDFVLWKKAKPGEPTWPSPWGPGRPGWHTECVVMSLDLLGDGFDIHGGGQDLAFPHHENERAQAVAAGRTSAKVWVHNGFVEVAGEKMSKSLGNFTTLLDMVESDDPRAYRLLVLRAHYRSPVEVTRESAADAAVALKRLDNVARRTAELTPRAADDEVLDEFRALMDDDLNTPGAFRVLFDQIRAANTALDEGRDFDAAVAWANIAEICQAVGLEPITQDQGLPDEIVAMATARDEARAAKDWAEADRLRGDIEAAGFTVEDTPAGTVVRR
jgi:cysteinyl-tRNA synthetase